MVLVPDSVERQIRTVFGKQGDRWLAELPAVVAERCRSWGLEVTGPAMTGGTHSYVAAVRRSADAGAAVLKITVPDEENRAEPSALYCYDGDGAVRLYAYDPDSKAMLLELATPGSPLVRQDVADVHIEGHDDQGGNVALACALYRRLWRSPAKLPDGFPEFSPVIDVVAEWSEVLPKAVARHVDRFDSGMAELVARKCEELSTPDGPVGLVNRDTHLGNIVAAQREPWLLIDPKPLLGERAYDAGFLALIQIESRLRLEHAQRVVHRTADLLGVAPERVRSWTLLRAVEEVSWQPEDSFGRRCLAIANLLHRMGDQGEAVA